MNPEFYHTIQILIIVSGFLLIFPVCFFVVSKINNGHPVLTRQQLDVYEGDAERVRDDTKENTEVFDVWPKD